MNNSTENYQKKLSMAGLLFMGGVEHNIQVKNVSISGLVASIELSAEIKDEKDIFLIMKKSTLVDFYIKKLNLAGEAEITEVDMEGGEILLSIEFKQISYNAESFLYKRKVYRKNMASPGIILIANKVYDFMTHNVSVTGFMIRISDYVDLQEEELIEFKFDNLQIHGKAVVVWVEHDGIRGTIVGLEYQRMKKADLSSIPTFYHDE
ncbi:MAG: PilZ domain-containing protein [Methyloprofundus sp.]|nr:PilZ domain-containing protein [Methyloprofundus sp.]